MIFLIKKFLFLGAVLSFVPAYSMVLTPDTFQDDVINRRYKKILDHIDNGHVWVNFVCPSGKSFLHHAVKDRSELGFNFAEELLRRGASTNAVDSKGKTPLHEAIGSLSHVTCLLKNGAQDVVFDNKGLRPLGRAYKAFGKNYSEYNQESALVVAAFLQHNPEQTAIYNKRCSAENVEKIEQIEQLYSLQGETFSALLDLKQSLREAHVVEKKQNPALVLSNRAMGLRKK